MSPPTLPVIPDPETAARLRAEYSGHRSVEPAVTAVEAFGLVDAVTAARLLATWPYLPTLSSLERSAVLAFFVDHPLSTDPPAVLVERALDAARSLPDEIADAVVAMAAVLLDEAEPIAAEHATAMVAEACRTLREERDEARRELSAALVEQERLTALFDRIRRTAAGSGMTTYAERVHRIRRIIADSGAGLPAAPDRPVDLVDQVGVPELWSGGGVQ